MSFALLAISLSTVAPVHAHRATLDPLEVRRIARGWMVKHAYGSANMSEAMKLLGELAKDGLSGVHKSAAGKPMRLYLDTHVSTPSPQLDDWVHIKVGDMSRMRSAIFPGNEPFLRNVKFRMSLSETDLRESHIVDSKLDGRRLTVTVKRRAAPLTWDFRPMGPRYEKLTLDLNEDYTVRSMRVANGFFRVTEPFWKSLDVEFPAK